jgi:hypothetical protein
LAASHRIAFVTPRIFPGGGVSGVFWVFKFGVVVGMEEVAGAFAELETVVGACAASAITASATAAIDNANLRRTFLLPSVINRSPGEEVEG